MERTHECILLKSIVFASDKTCCLSHNSMRFFSGVMKRVKENIVAWNCLFVHHVPETLAHHKLPAVLPNDFVSSKPCQPKHGLL